MEDPKRRLADWWNAGHTVAVATVCDTWQSAPRVALARSWCSDPTER